MPTDEYWNDEKGIFENGHYAGKLGDNKTVDSPAYSPDPYAHAVRHLDDAQEWRDQQNYSDIPHYTKDTALVDALVGIGLALLAIARQR